MMKMKNKEIGWNVRKSDRENACEIFFNDVRVGALYNNSIYRGMSPIIMINPSNYIPDMRISICNNKFANLKNDDYCIHFGMIPERNKIY